MIHLKPGDIFVSENPWFIGRAINAVQAFWARDREANYGHAGIILSPDGTTLEALWKVKSQDLYEAYRGRQILVGRHTGLKSAEMWRGMREILAKRGDVYPLHRLLFFVFPPAARWINVFGWTTCGEMVAEYLHKAGKLDYWSGVNPDDLTEIIHHWKNWKVVFEGTLA